MAVPKTYPAGVQTLSPLTGAEYVEVDNGGSVKVRATSQAIANLGLAASFRAVTALPTVGNGTVTAAGMVNGITSRTGSQSNTAFTDTTATGAQLDAALTNPRVGQSFDWAYQNTTNANATISGGTGVTVSGITVALSGTTTRYLVTRTGVATYTVVGYEATSAAGSSGTYVCNGATPVTVTDSRVTANSSITSTLKTVGGTVGATPAVKTITPGTGFTVAGTASDTSTYNYLIEG
jgi:hypothetical protein